jgi:hypothetical protein
MIPVLRIGTMLIPRAGYAASPEPEPLEDRAAQLTPLKKLIQRQRNEPEVVGRDSPQIEASVATSAQLDRCNYCSCSRAVPEYTADKTAPDHAQNSYDHDQLPDAGSYRSASSSQVHRKEHNRPLAQ